MSAMVVEMVEIQETRSLKEMEQEEQEAIQEQVEMVEIGIITDRLVRVVAAVVALVTAEQLQGRKAGEHGAVAWAFSALGLTEPGEQITQAIQPQMAAVDRAV